MIEEELIEFKKTLLFLNKKVNQTMDRLQEFSDRVEQKAKVAIDRATEQRYQELEARTQRLMEESTVNIRKQIQATDYIHRRLSKHYWIGIGSAFLMGTLMIVAPTLYLYSKQKEIRSARHTLEVLRALDQYQFNTCGGKLCVKVDRNDPIWKNSEDYIIIK